jgi:uncharacterized protein (TIGR03435 family)
MRAMVATSLVLAGGLFAQPAFEVASIRPNKTGGERSGREGNGREGSGRENIITSPGTLSMRNVTLKSCIKWAYNVQDAQVSGPDSLSVDRFDVLAKASDAAPDTQLRLMLQRLLADRFKLALHRESKTMAGYALVVGKNGPKLRTSEGEGEPDVQSWNLRMTAKRFSTTDLAGLMAVPLQTPVVDMTGLKGRYDFTLDASPFFSIDTPIDKSDMQATVASVFQQALEQQLGLKLEGRKIPVEVLVIDHTEKPSEN